jgi:Sigma-70, region 4
MLGTLNCISASGLRTSFDYSALFKSSNSWLCAGHLRVRILDTDVLCSAAIPPSRLLTRVAIWGATPRTLEVGNKLGVTRERIRQLQNLALVKLRRALSMKETPTYLLALAENAHSFSNNGKLQWVDNSPRAPALSRNRPWKAKRTVRVSTVD